MIKCEKCGYALVTEEMNYCPHCGSSLLPEIEVSDEVRDKLYSVIDGAEVVTLEQLSVQGGCERNTVYLFLKDLKRKSEWRVSRCKVILGEDTAPSVNNVSAEVDQISDGQRKIIYAISKYVKEKFTGTTRKEASDYIDRYKRVLPPKKY